MRPVRKGECGEGDEVDELIRSVGCRRRLVHGPEHRDGQDERHGKCQGNVEVLTHPPGCNWGRTQTQAWAFRWAYSRLGKKGRQIKG
jgi:hypothetical protein